MTRQKIELWSSEFKPSALSTKLLHNPYEKDGIQFAAEFVFTSFSV